MKCGTKEQRKAARHRFPFLCVCLCVYICAHARAHMQVLSSTYVRGDCTSGLGAKERQNPPSLSTIIPESPSYPTPVSTPSPHRVVLQEVQKQPSIAFDCLTTGAVI